MREVGYSSKRIDHLGLVAGFCKAVGLASLIDRHIPEQSPYRHLSYGQLVEAMILNGLGFVSRTLHVFPEYFADKPVERLLGEGICAEHINDDALGRCLDKLYALGVSEVYQTIAAHVVRHLGLTCELLHLDSTSFHVDGEYASDGGTTQAIRLTRGYSRDHRPDLNQVVLNLITENRAGLPVYMQAVSGNSNDSQAFKQIVSSHIKSLEAAQYCQYLVGDASLYVAETLKILDQEGRHFISRVPQKLNEAKAVIAEKSSLVFETLSQGYRGAWVDSNYGDVQQKWLLVDSEQAKAREKKTLSKQILKNTEQGIKQFKRLCAQFFSCASDAQQALEKWEAEQAFLEVAAFEITAQKHYQKPGRPQNGDTGKTVYKIMGELCTSLNKKAEQADKKGLFIIATNDCSGQLSMQELLDHYKSQQSVERGFRFLKSPEFLVSSVFLKKPERIEALLMIMTCCLMVYAALEYQIRQQLKEKGLFFPDMKNKPSQTPTARWVFFCFQGIDELATDSQTLLILNLKERHHIILNSLGPPYQKIYS